MRKQTDQTAKVHPWKRSTGDERRHAVTHFQSVSLSGEIVTKVDQFDSSLRCQQDVVAFDVTMDNPVVVQMLETL